MPPKSKKRGRRLAAKVTAEQAAKTAAVSLVEAPNDVNRANAPAVYTIGCGHAFRFIAPWALWLNLLPRRRCRTTRSDVSSTPTVEYQPPGRKAKTLASDHNSQRPSMEPSADTLEDQGSNTNVMLEQAETEDEKGFRVKDLKQGGCHDPEVANWLTVSKTN